MSAKVFVSGATGYVAGHVVELLLKRGYQVVGSVRSLENEKKVEHLRKMENQQNLKLVEASLQDKNSWVKAMEGCEYLIHTASPFPAVVPKDPENEIIKPAVEGTENVLNAAIKNNIKKVVLTSSGAAIFPGNDNKNFFTEKDWSKPKVSPPYEASKHLAEKKAWEIVENNKKNGGTMELSVINPLFVQGPGHSASNIFTSSGFIIQLLTNKMPGLAKMSIGYVDVREVAVAHVNAMERDIANGKRYLLVEGSYWLEDIATMLRLEFEQYGYKIPSKVVGNCMMSIAAKFDPQAKALKPYLGRLMMFDNTASQQDLDIRYRPVRETLLDTGYDLIEKKQVPNLLPKGHRQTHQTNQFPSVY